MVEVRLESTLVEAKLVLDSKALGTAACENVENARKALFLLFEAERDGGEEQLVKVMVLEEDSGDTAEDVFFVGDKRVPALLPCPAQHVVVHDCLPQKHQELFHVIHQFFQAVAGHFSRGVLAIDDSNKLALQQSQHAFLVFQVNVQLL